METSSHCFTVAVRPFNAAVIKNDQIIAALLQRADLAANAVLVVEVHARIILARRVFKTLGGVVKNDFSAAVLYFGIAFDGAAVRNDRVEISGDGFADPSVLIISPALSILTGVPSP